MRKNTGFTLIEIAIVLVIIGLILGGVLQGQQLIQGARVRSLANQVNSITVAWFAFVDRYRSIPGDFGAATTQINSTLSNGDGDGDVQAAEIGAVWTHLAGAGMLSGAYSGTVASATYSCAAAACPQNPYNGGMIIAYGKESAVSDGSSNLVAASGDANELWSGHNIPVAVLAELDRKMDDGLPGSGRMTIAVGGGSGWSKMSSCASQSYYEVANGESDCAAIFRNF